MEEAPIGIYVLMNPLAIIEERLRPESFVTFYFDGRIEQSLDSPETKAKIEKMLSELPKWNCLYVGFLDEDGVRIDMMDFSSPDDPDFQEFEFTSTRPIFYGNEPGFDDGDGFNVISLMLPDIDGVIRPYKID